MTLLCSCDHLFSYKTFRNGKLHSETYLQTFADIVDKFPSLTLGQLNKLNVLRPIEHQVGDTHYEFLIQELVDDRRREDEVYS